MPVATLTPDGSRIAVYTTYQDKERIQLVPGLRRNGKEGVWELPLAWASCITLRGVFGAELQLEPSLVDWARAETERRIKPVAALREALDAELPGADPRLRSYQRAGVAWLLAVGSGLLADDMGSGKTVQVAQALDIIGPESLPALIICPNSVKRDWARHLTAWNSHARPYVVTGTAAKRRKIILTAAEDERAAIIVNIEAMRSFSRLAPFGPVALRKCRECDPREGEEGLKTSQCHKHPKELNAIPFRTVVFDEGHRMQSPASQQSRAAWAVMHAPSVTRRWVLTGTPIGGEMENLWPLMHGLAPEDYPAKTAWMERNAEYAWSPFGSPIVVGVKAEMREEFHRILDTRMRRMPKELILKDLPPIVRMQRLVQMSAKQAKAYKEMADQMMTRLDDGSVMVSGDNLVKHLRLLQFSSSYAEMVPGTKRVLNPETGEMEDQPTMDVRLKEPSPKIDELVSLLGDMDPSRQVAVCAVSSQLIDMAAARLTAEGITHGVITGAVNEASRTYALDQFQQGSTRVLLFTMGAGGTGLTMTAADTLICMQRSYRLIENIQTEGRVYRIGSERHASVTIIDLVTEGTVEDESQIPALMKKFERLEEIVRDRERLRAAGLDTSHLDAEETGIHASTLEGS